MASGIKTSATWKEVGSAFWKNATLLLIKGMANAAAATAPQRQIASETTTPWDTLIVFIITKYWVPASAPGVKSTPTNAANRTQTAKLTAARGKERIGKQALDRNAGQEDADACCHTNDNVLDTTRLGGRNGIGAHILLSRDGQAPIL